LSTGDTADALAVIQARMSSARRPGKTLADVGGEPLLSLVVRRLARAARVGRIVIATSTGPEDDPIAELASELGVGAHRGPRDDVLTRYVEAVGSHRGTVVRITGDCPFIDPAVVDAAIELLESTSGCAYVNNVEPRTYPDGLDVEAFSAEALLAAAAEATDPADREHVTTAIRRAPDRWPQANLPGDPDLAEVRWTVDTEDDLEFVRLVIERLGDRRHSAGLDQIRAAVLAEPSLAEYGGARRA
jgi:spore coat polysaccharide biosynthesis protein SpsF (cytidylyltransferase family)